MGLLKQNTKGLRLLEVQTNLYSLEVSYDELGMIHYVNVYSEFVNDYVAIDLARFEVQYPSRYNYLQQQVNDELALDYKEYK